MFDFYLQLQVNISQILLFFLWILSLGFPAPDLLFTILFYFFN